jgi:hypothetical protein
MGEIEKLKDFTGKAYRVDIENIGIPNKATAGDIVRFEREELGNTMDVPDELLGELDGYSHRDIVWVTRTRDDARFYLSEGMMARDISSFYLPANSKIVADDGQGGYLVLRGGTIKRGEATRC